MLTIVISLLFSGLTLLYFYITMSPTIPVKPLLPIPWSFSYTGWHSRALLTPHPSPHKFMPTYNSLIFAASFNSFDGMGISLTFYSSLFSNSVILNNIIAVDNVGRVLLVSPGDGAGIMALARKTLEVPLMHWSIKEEVSCPTIDYL